jgi:VWFA-related protein
MSIRTAVAFAAWLAATAQPGAPRVRIETPADDALVVGPTRLRAIVEPVDAASELAFSVDGREVCIVRTAPFDCAWDAGQAIVEHQIRAVATLAAGGRIVHAVHTRAAGVTETVDIDVVQVSVSVLDGRSRYVRGLPRSAFHVTEDGRPQPITHFYAQDVPLQLVVAVDISGSMQRSMPALKRAILELLAAVPPRDRVTLIGFNEYAFTLARDTGDPRAQVDAVNRLAPWGSTALYDAVVHGVELLNAQAGRKALIVFTDGEDTASHVTVPEVDRVLQSSDATLFMIGPNRGAATDRLKRTMERLAAPTGGRALFTNSVDDLRDAFTELLDELSNQYGLGYQSTNHSRDGAWRQIAVAVDGYPRLRARQGYRSSK